MYNDLNSPTLRLKMSDLFNNPMVNEAKSSMTPEQLEDYQRMGEEMYNTIEFETSKLLNPEKSSNIELESVAYVVEGLKSGLLPSELDEDEVALLVNHYGEDWMDKVY